MRPESIEDIVSLRVYKCECGFIGAEEKALEHQCKCDLPMEQIV